MKSIINGVEYHITWNHVLPDHTKIGAGTNGGTTCFIYRWSNDKKILIAKSEIDCYFRDQFDKKTGRKYSLANALQFAGMDRPERTLVWKSYWEFLSPTKKEEYAETGVEI